MAAPSAIAVECHHQRLQVGGQARVGQRHGVDRGRSPRPSRPGTRRRALDDAPRRCPACPARSRGARGGRCARSRRRGSSRRRTPRSRRRSGPALDLRDQMDATTVGLDANQLQLLGSTPAATRCARRWRSSTTRPRARRRAPPSSASRSSRTSSSRSRRWASRRSSPTSSAPSAGAYPLRVVRRRGLLPPPAARDGRSCSRPTARPRRAVHRRWPDRRDLPRHQRRDRPRRPPARVPRRGRHRRRGRSRRGRRRHRAGADRPPAAGRALRERARPGQAADRHPRGRGHGHVRATSGVRRRRAAEAAGRRRPPPRSPRPDRRRALAATRPRSCRSRASRATSAPALERLGELAGRSGLEADLHRHDLAALRAHPDHPGEEAPRDELCGLTVTAARRRAGPAAAGDRRRTSTSSRPGTVPWRHGPWSGAVEDGFAPRPRQRRHEGRRRRRAARPGERRAAAGAARPRSCSSRSPPRRTAASAPFAALERDAAFAACLIPEPTGFDVVCAQAGALTFEGTVRGVAAHAAHRLEGVSAIDRYLPVHAALAAHERALNADVEHPLMRALELPYPLLVGRIAAGEWSSSVPDRLVLRGPRAGARGRGAGAGARGGRGRRWPRAGDGAVDAALRRRAVRVRRDGAGPPVRAARRAAVGAELGREARVAGVPWGADMRLCARAASRA